MKKNFITKLGGLIVSLFLLLPLNAFALNPETADSLYFKLADDTAFIKNTVTSAGDQIATIAFSVKYDSSWSGVLTNIRLQLSYDDTLLTYEGAYKDSANWDGDFGVDTSTSGVLILSFDQGGVISFDTSSYTSYAHIQFKPLCQAEISSSSLVLSQNGFNSNITVSTAAYYPDSGNWDDGTVTTADYIGSFAIHDSTFSSTCGDIVSIPVYATTNFRSRLFYHWIVYDEDKLEFAGLVNEIWTFLTPDTSRTDTLTVQCFAILGEDEFSDESIYKVKFKLLDSLQGDSTFLSFYEDSSFLQVYSCVGISVGETYSDTATISKTLDTAVYKAVYSGGSVAMSDDGAHLDFRLLMKNSFVAGLTDGQVNDTGIRVNINLGKNLSLDFVDSTYESVKFSKTIVDDSLAAIYQIYDMSKLNYIDTNSSYDTLLSFEARFSVAGFVPDWNDRYLHPKFVNDFSGSRGSAVVPDTGDCTEADSTNGQLRFWGADLFDSVEVEMGQFVIIGNNSVLPCTDFDLYVRSSFALDSFSIRAAVPTLYCIYSVTDKMTGVVDSSVNDYTYDIYTNSSFTTLGSSDTLIKICKINAGLNFCISNTVYSIDLSLSNDQMWDSIGSEHFVDADGDSADAKCSNGFGCFNCPGGLLATGLNEFDDNGLPTEFALYQNYPNPFNPMTTISFDLPVVTDYELVIYNILGQSVETFAGHGKPGRVSIDWDASHLASGIYLYRIIAGEYTERKKMLLLK